VYITLDPNIAPLDDARLRHALALALDKTQLAKIIRGAIPTNHLIPPGTGDYPATLSGPSASAPLAGNVAQAQALWQSYVQDRCGGVASRCPVVTVFELGAIAWPSPLELAVMARWRATLPGLRLDQVQVPGTLIVSWPPPTAANDVYLFEDYPDPQGWWLSYANVPGYSQSADGNYPLVHEPQTDALVARAEATLDPTARLALYQQAEDILLNDAVVVPIAQQQDTWEVKPGVSGIPANPAPWIAPAAWARIYLMGPASK
jgi:ABC-type transport system substrate-binding protein